ncbi:MAG: hypothetical protein JRF30_09715 [Deltaproteobacteria bacterium]|nr:hypothetical protein [Deltaproteobacteria bacterium]MBW2331179.1 hypothetical protein [Deltaproteobacteria bacterium]
MLDTRYWKNNKKAFLARPGASRCPRAIKLAIQARPGATDRRGGFIPPE